MLPALDTADAQSLGQGAERSLCVFLEFREGRYLCARGRKLAGSVGIGEESDGRLGVDEHKVGDIRENRGRLFREMG
jgi:hypothetical protein